MNVLILAAGEPPLLGGTSYPVWLAEVDGELILERQVKALAQLTPNRFIFVFRRMDVETFYLGEIIEQLAPGSTIIQVNHETAGAACTALLSIGAIAMDEELIIASATDQIEVNFDLVLGKFRSQAADAGVLTFSSLHPRYSYVRTDSQGFVVESSEKRPISRKASTGLYWFAKAADFYEAAREMIIKDAHVQGVFYICPTLNELILRQKKIVTYQLAADQYHPLKSDKHVSDFELSMEDVGNENR